MHEVQRIALQNMLENLKEGKEIHKETLIFVLEAALQEEFEYKQD